MKSGVIVAVIIVTGYLGFELYALQKLRYRTEPLYIHAEYVGANRATTRCGDPPAAERRDFLRNLGVVTRRAAEDLAETHPRKSAGEIEGMLAERTSAREREVDALIDAAGCGSRDVWRLVKLHEVRARLNLR